MKGRSSDVVVFELCDGDPRPLREAKGARRAEFEAALSASESEKADEARALWAELAQDAPDDRVPQQMLQRIAPAGDLGS